MRSTSYAYIQFIEFCIAVLQRSNFTSENILEMFTVLLVAKKWLKHYCKFYL